MLYKILFLNRSHIEFHYINRAFLEEFEETIFVYNAARHHYSTKEADKLPTNFFIC